MRRLAWSRRGAVETPIIMIFSVTAGVMILLLATWGAFKLISSAQDTQTLESISIIRRGLILASLSPDTNQNISTLDNSLEFKCDLDTGATIGYGDKTATLPDTTIVAAPKALGGGQLETHTISLGEAYHTGNVLIVTSPANSIVEPPNYDIGGYDLTTGPFPISITRTTNIDGATTISTVDITPGTDSTYGKVTFDGTDESVYLSPGLAVAAAVSDNKAQYDCVLMRYLKQLRFVNAVQQERVNSIKYTYSQETPPNPCGRSFTLAPYQTIEDTLKDVIETQRELTEDDAAAIVGAERVIEKANGDLIRGDNCATLS